MANVFLDQNEAFILADSANVFGQSTTDEAILLQDNVTDVTLDGNIERLDVPSDASDTTFQVNDSGQLEVMIKGAVAVTYAAGLNQPVDVRMGGGNVTLTQTGASEWDIANPDNAGDTVTINADNAQTGDAVGLGGDGSATGDGSGGGGAQDPITIADDGETFNAGASDVTYDISGGSYSVTIDNFDAGDVLDARDVGGVDSAASFNVVSDRDQADGQQQVALVDPVAAAITTITLTGLSEQQDSDVFNGDSFRDVFGQDSVLL